MFNRRSLKDTTQIPSNDLPKGLTVDSTIEEFQNIFMHRLVIEWEDLNARIPLMKKCFIDDVLNIPPPKSARNLMDSSSKNDLTLNVYESYDNLPPPIAPEPEPVYQ